MFADLQAAVWLSRDEFEWRGDARRFETFERSVAGMIGLGVATEHANALNMAAIETRVRKLAMELVSKVADVPGVRVHEKSGERSGIVTLTLENIPAASLQQLLRRQGVNTSVSRGANARLTWSLNRLGMCFAHRYITTILKRKLTVLWNCWRRVKGDYTGKVN